MSKKLQNAMKCKYSMNTDEYGIEKKKRIDKIKLNNFQAEQMKHEIEMKKSKIKQKRSEIVIKNCAVKIKQLEADKAKIHSEYEIQAVENEIKKIESEIEEKEESIKLKKHNSDNLQYEIDQIVKLEQKEKIKATEMQKTKKPSKKVKEYIDFSDNDEEDICI
jgi:hypothetical protein